MSKTAKIVIFTIALCLMLMFVPLYLFSQFQSMQQAAMTNALSAQATQQVLQAVVDQHKAISATTTANAIATAIAPTATPYIQPTPDMLGWTFINCYNRSGHGDPITCDTGYQVIELSCTYPPLKDNWYAYATCSSSMGSGYFKILAIGWDNYDGIYRYTITRIS